MYNTSQLTAEESGNVDHEDNLADKDSNKDMEKDASMLQQFRFEIAYKRDNQRTHDFFQNSMSYLKSIRFENH